MIKHKSLKHKSVRVRKKLHVGEFQVLGSRFSATISLSGTVDDRMERVSAIMDGLIETLDQHHLTTCCVFGFDTCSGVVFPDHPRNPERSITAHDVQLIYKTLMQYNELSDVRVSSAFDLYYDDPDTA